MVTPRDHAFADRAVAFGLVTPAQASECLSLLRDAREPLADLFVARGLITPAQVDAVMAELQARGLPEGGKGEAGLSGIAGAATVVQPASHGPGNPLEASGPPVALPRVPGFEILSPLGRGGMGAVYKARQLSMDRLVAIKVLHPSYAREREGRERFLREARAVAALNHPRIVRGIDSGESGGLLYFAMEYVDGESLRDRLDRGPLPEAEAAAVVRQVAEALDHAQQNALIHRDIKPQNILLAKDGTAKLTDLGLAKSTSGDDPGLTQEGMVVGTPYYVAPEQARGDRNLDIRSDLYALGATWYECLVGRPPFDGDTTAVIFTKHLKEPVSFPPETKGRWAEGTRRIIARLLAKRREERHATPRELLADLDALSSGRRAATAGASSGVASPERKAAAARDSTISRSHGLRAGAATARSGGAGAAVGIGLAVAAVLGAVLLLSGGRESRTPPPKPLPRTDAMRDNGVNLDAAVTTGDEGRGTRDEGESLSPVPPPVFPPAPASEIDPLRQRYEEALAFAQAHPGDSELDSVLERFRVVAVGDARSSARAKAAAWVEENRPKVERLYAAALAEIEREARQAPGGEGNWRKALAAADRAANRFKGPDWAPRVSALRTALLGDARKAGEAVLAEIDRLASLNELEKSRALCDGFDRFTHEDLAKAAGERAGVIAKRLEETRGLEARRKAFDKAHAAFLGLLKHKKFAEARAAVGPFAADGPDDAIRAAARADWAEITAAQARDLIEQAEALAKRKPPQTEAAWQKLRDFEALPASDAIRAFAPRAALLRAFLGGEIVLSAGEAGRGVHGAWKRVADPAAGGGQCLLAPAAAVLQVRKQTVGGDLDEMVDYVEFPFFAFAETPYAVWARIKPDAGNPRNSDSVWIQLGDSLDPQKRKAWRIGTEDALGAMLFAERPRGWGWARANLAPGDPRFRREANTTPVVFAETGMHVLRVSPREPTTSFDQIILSSREYLDVPPQDNQIVKRPSLK